MLPEKLPIELKKLSLNLKGRLQFSTQSSSENDQAPLSSEEFKRFVELSRCLRTFDLANLKMASEKLAFWINLYNSLTIHAILVYHLKRTVWDVPHFFDCAAYDIDGWRFSLNDIENGILRGNRAAPYHLFPPFSSKDPRKKFALTLKEFDPRVHFALNCGSRSCPPIEFYDPFYIDQQLDKAARAFIQSTTRIQGNQLILSSIFKWYHGDFGNLKIFISGYLLPELRSQLKGKRIVFSQYDWSLSE